MRPHASKPGSCSARSAPPAGSNRFATRIADFDTVFATTDRAKKDKGIGCFVVAADTPGVRLVRALVLSAPHPLGEIAFQKVRIPSECRLDGPGEGFKLGLATLDRVRATVGAAACGMASRALAE